MATDLEIRSLASDPDEVNIIGAAKFRDLTNLVPNAVRGLCNSKYCVCFMAFV